MAETAIDQMNYAEAENLIQRALLMEPTRQDVIFLKSVNLYLQQKYDKAAELLQEQIQNGSKDPSVIKLLEHIMDMFNNQVSMQAN
jgi:Flp pilus assembly protein TadD